MSDNDYLSIDLIKKTREEKLKDLCDNFLTLNGWFASWQNDKCIDENADFIPWYNYGMIDFLKTRLTKKIKVFEFGSGYSTLFYSKNAAEVVSIETNEFWFKKINNLIKENDIRNVSLILCTKNNFVEKIDNLNTFDLIVIDSIERNRCVKKALFHLSKDGVILIDNLERPSLMESIQLLHGVGFKSLIFTGIGPLRSRPSKTGIFYRQDNVFNL